MDLQCLHSNTRAHTHTHGDLYRQCLLIKQADAEARAVYVHSTFSSNKARIVMKIKGVGRERKEGFHLLSKYLNPPFPLQAYR